MACLSKLGGDIDIERAMKEQVILERKKREEQQKLTEKIKREIDRAAEP